LRKFGKKVLAGDFVAKSDEFIEKAELEGDGLDEHEEAQETTDVSSGVVEVKEGEEDKYSLFDVILPIVGYKVKMPANPEMREIIEKIMKEDNISVEKF